MFYGLAWLGTFQAGALFQPFVEVVTYICLFGKEIGLVVVHGGSSGVFVVTDKLYHNVLPVSTLLLFRGDCFCCG